MGHNNICSDYNSLIGPGLVVVVVAMEFYKFWLKAVALLGPTRLYRHLKP